MNRLFVCDSLCEEAPSPHSLRFRGVCPADVSYYHLAGNPALRPLAAIEERGARSTWLVLEGHGVYVAQRLYIRDDVRRWYVLYEARLGLIGDYPAPPLPGVTSRLTVWTRFVSKDFRVALLPGGGAAPIDSSVQGKDVMNFANNSQPVVEILCKKYIRKCDKLDNYTLPGSSRLVGEEFRVKELDNDYLRLVGRGGDEYLAWDFVLGTLDTGEWILLGEDGLYTAVYKDGVVVVEKPYDGLIIDVRGPPRAYLYPVVPTRSFKHARLYGANVVEDASLLKWPLVVSPVDKCATPSDGLILIGVEASTALCCKAYRPVYAGERPPVRKTA